MIDEFWRQCVYCCERRYFDEFPKGRRCRMCLRAVDRERGPAKHRAAKMTCRATLAINTARHRARKAGLRWDLDDHRAELKARFDRGVCEMTGIPFDFQARGQVWNSPSIDQIKPGAGYMIANVRIILFGLNAAMGTWGIDRLREMVDAV